jgi:DNA processing protein
MNKFSNINLNNETEFLASFRLARTKNIGAVTFLKLLDKFQTPSNIIKNGKYFFEKRNIEIETEQNVLKEIEETEKLGGKIISIFSDLYPELLSEIYNLPIIISYFGKIEKISSNAVAIVGSRYASANAVTYSYKISKDITDNNFTVVSGLARGIDTAAHKGALESSNSNILKTIAVIGGGLDNIYPKENEKLFEKIKNEGVIISENPIGIPPKSENFPRRNRIISGLSLGSIVVEAAIKSGSLITAKFALEQGREVMSVPGFPLDSRSEGTNKLLKNGATLITDVADVISALNYHSQAKIPNYTNNKNQTLLNIFSENNDADYESEIVKEDDNNLSFKLLDKLSTSPTSIEELSEQTGLTIYTINSLLVEYELSEEIIRYSGGKVSKKS